MEKVKNYEGNNHSMSDKNAGTAGGDPPEKTYKEGNGSFKNIGVPKANETGYAENEENHSEDNYVQEAIKKRMENSNDIVDQDAPGNTRHVSKNHVKNIGGTSEDEKYNSDSPNGEGL